MKNLEPQKQYQIEQVAATMAIEDMPLDACTQECLARIATGKNTADQIISEIEKEYASG